MPAVDVEHDRDRLVAEHAGDRVARAEGGAVGGMGAADEPGAGMGGVQPPRETERMQAPDGVEGVVARGLQVDDDLIARGGERAKVAPGRARERCEHLQAAAEKAAAHVEPWCFIVAVQQRSSGRGFIACVLVQAAFPGPSSQ